MREDQHPTQANEARRYSGKTDADLSAGPEVAILRDSVPKSKLGLFATLLLELGIVIFLIVIVFVDIYILRPGSFSTTDHAFYVIRVTIIASLVSAIGVGQVRQYWLARILPAFKSDHGIGMQDDLGRARTVLGLGTWRHPLQYRLVTLSMIFAGLVTAAIVAATSPTAILVNQGVTASLTSDDDSSDFYSSPTSDDSWFNWQMSNTSYLNLDTSFQRLNRSYSPIRRVAQIIDAPVPLGYPYAIQQFVVDPRAIGIPFSTETGGFPIDNSGKWGPGLADFALLQSISGCLPVLISNPVQCTRAGNLTISGHEIVLESDKCRTSSSVYEVDPASQPASASGACTQNRTIGKATLLFGSINEHADFLATVMNDHGFASSPKNTNRSYVVSCEVDIAPSIGFRSVNFSRILDVTTTVSDFSKNGATFVIQGSDQLCTPTSVGGPLDVSNFTTDVMLATGAAASWSLLAEGTYRDGWCNTLYHATSQRNNLVKPGSTYSLDFQNSRNPLEDALGLASGIALGFFWGEGSQTHCHKTNMTAAIQGLRIGPGRAWALVFIVPQLYVIVLLLYLAFWPNPRRTRRSPEEDPIEFQGLVASQHAKPPQGPEEFYAPSFAEPNHDPWTSNSPSMIDGRNSRSQALGGTSGYHMIGNESAVKR